MYPEATVSSGGAGDWKASLSPALREKVPEDAVRCVQTNEGATIFYNSEGNVVGDPKGYSANGSVFTASTEQTQNTQSTQTSQGTQTGNNPVSQNQGNPSIFNFPGGQIGTDLSQSWMNGSYYIDPGTFQSASNGMFAGIFANLFSGGLFGMGWLTNLFSGFMSALNFNFDFSNISTSSQSSRVPTGFPEDKVPEGATRWTVSGGVYKFYGSDGKIVGSENGYGLDGSEVTTTQSADEGQVQHTAIAEGSKPTGYAGDVPSGATQYDVNDGVYTFYGASGNKLGDYNADGTAHVTQGGGTTSAAGGTTTTTRTGGVPEGWSRAGSEAGFFGDDFKPVVRKKDRETSEWEIYYRGANDVASYLINKFGVEGLSNDQIESLSRALISANPSVFNSDGTLKNGVTDWSKLDFPASKEALMAACGSDSPAAANPAATNNSAQTRDASVVQTAFDKLFSDNDIEGFVSQNITIDELSQIMNSISTNHRVTTTEKNGQIEITVKEGTNDTWTIHKSRTFTFDKSTGRLVSLSSNSGGYTSIEDITYDQNGNLSSYTSNTSPIGMQAYHGTATHYFKDGEEIKKVIGGHRSNGYAITENLPTSTYYFGSENFEQERPQFDVSLLSPSTPGYRSDGSGAVVENDQCTIRSYTEANYRNAMYVYMGTQPIPDEDYATLAKYIYTDKQTGEVYVLDENGNALSKLKCQGGPVHWRE